jgi:hypothetical protein
VNSDPWGASPSIPPAIGSSRVAETTVAATANELAERLRCTVWLPTSWPRRFGNPELVSVHDAGPLRYQVRSVVLGEPLVLVGRLHADRQPTIGRALVGVPGLPWPTWEASEGSTHLLTWLPADQLAVHLVGACTRSEALRTMGSLTRVSL